MLTPDIILELHRRTHFGMVNLLDHCRRLSAEELHRELPGIGFPTVQQQLYHMISAEAYWLLVLRGRFDADSQLSAEDRVQFGEAKYATVDALEGFRAHAAAGTEAYLRESTAESLAEPAQFRTIDPGVVETLVPEYVLMRIITHYFHHRGLVAAMCRMLGHPVPAARAFLDFPLDPELPDSGSLA